MPKYYELMLLIRKERIGEDISVGVKRYEHTDEFKDGDDLDKRAQNVEIDSESETVATAIGIIRWLLKNDESVKGKYSFKKKK